MENNKHRDRAMDQRNLAASARAFRHRDEVLRRHGYYTSGELLELSAGAGFELFDPTARVRRGTRIEGGAVLMDGTAIDGEDVVIGAQCVLDGAVIRGSDVRLGRRCRVTGVLAPDHVHMGDDNTVDSLSGRCLGQVVIGHGNMIDHVEVQNLGPNRVTIGHHNRLHPNLHLNASFHRGDIWIGNCNQLGRDGGGVVSTSYRFSQKWWGHVVVGSHVETTRGAEILGFSLVGWPAGDLARFAPGGEAAWADLFIRGDVDKVVDLMERLQRCDPGELPHEPGGAMRVSVFGVAKLKRCWLIDAVRVKDETRPFCACLRSVDVPERCNIYHAAILPPAGTYHKMTTPGRCVEDTIVRQAVRWDELPETLVSDRYPPGDEAFYAGPGAPAG